MPDCIPGCLSCDIVSGREVEPGGPIFENETWHVGHARGPVVWPGFLIVKLNRHCEHLALLAPEEAAALGPLIQRTCRAVMVVLNPAKVYVCSFGDGIKHIHFWVLPRPQGMRPGMHTMMRNLDLRIALTRFLGIKRWLCSDQEVSDLVEKLRAQLYTMRAAL
jgi:diadenosine tetraphosphate (Ap4A) HIT family hydrolase